MMKVLFVLSRDHGELFNAMYFSEGQSFQSILLLPENLYRVNYETIGLRCYNYEGVDSIISAIEVEKPNIVLLFSGYLFVINGLLDQPALNRLLCVIENAKIPLATSDPTGGIIPQYGESTIEFRPGQRTLSRHMGWLAKRFKDHAHLYTAPPLPGAERSFAFYNREIISISSQSSTKANCNSENKRWLFVLSREDYDVQIKRHGETAFIKSLADKYEQGRIAGRSVMFLAPADCIHSIARSLKLIPESVGLAVCSYHRYMEVLLSSEYVFCWNSFSASLVGRAMNRGPFFVFDRGHLSDFLEQFFERAREQFYFDAEPPLLQLNEQLVPDQLARYAEIHLRKIDSSLHHLAKCPAPVDTLRQILDFHTNSKSGQ